MQARGGDTHSGASLVSTDAGSAAGSFLPFNFESESSPLWVSGFGFRLILLTLFRSKVIRIFN